MSFKLYGSEEPKVSPPPLAPEPEVSTEALFDQLDRHMKAYESVQIIHSEIAAEELTFVDKKNVVLFNEYLRVLQTNLGVAPQQVNPVALEQMHITSVNYEISLEGWMKSIWEKIKGFFKKIYDAVGAFMKRHFTRLGRLKNKLENISKVASETKKNIGLARLDDLPSGLVSMFKGFDDISEAVVSKAIATAKDAVEEIKNIVAITQKAASTGIVDQNFIAEIKKLKDTATATTAKIAENKSKETTGVKGLYGEGKANNKAIKEENKSLQQIANDATDDANTKDAEVVSLGKDMDDTDEGHEQKAQEFYKAYMSDVMKSMEKHVNVRMVGVKMITKVEINSEGQLEVTLEENDEEEPKGAVLTNSEGVKTLADAALAVIKAAEDMASGYAKVNDEIMKRLQDVDSLIADIDRIDPERYGKYKSVLDKRIRSRLRMMQNLFRSYNQVNKNFFEVAMNTGDGVVDYCVTSMKHFR